MICFYNYLEVTTSQSKQNNYDCIMDNVIFNGVAWKLDQSDVTLNFEHSNNLKFMSNFNGIFVQTEHHR